VTSRCFREKTFAEACQRVVDLEFDKIEIWMDHHSDHLDPEFVAAEPEKFYSNFHEITRLTPIAFYLEHDVSPGVLKGLLQAAKLLKITQMTLPASPVGTPFNTEIDRLRAFVSLSSQEGVRISLKTSSGVMTEDPDTAVELCKAVPGLGLTLDPSYYICGRNGSVSYERVFPYVFNTHLRDSKPGELQMPVGLGQIDYGRLIAQLGKENYQSALSVDLLLPDSEEGTEDSRFLEMRKLRMLLISLL